MSSDALTTAARSGRPVSIDPEAVASLALEMFAEGGFEQTSMEDIARAAGVGRKSLYRHFANKADLVWGGMEPAIEASAVLLGSPPSPNMTREEILDGLRNALIAGVSALPDLAVTRGRLRLIREHPELMSRSYDFLAPQRDRTRWYLTQRGIPETTARYVSAALIGASFEAWLQWAAGDEPSPVAHLQAAFAVLHLDQPRPS